MGVKDSTTQERGWIQTSASITRTFKLLALALEEESVFKEAKEEVSRRIE